METIFENKHRWRMNIDADMRLYTFGESIMSDLQLEFGRHGTLINCGRAH